VTLHDFRVGFSSSFPSLFSELHTHIENTWSHMFDRCELYLESCLCSFCVTLKYLQNQIYSIPAFCSDRFEEFVDVINLAWFENISKNQEVALLELHLIYHLIHFPTSYVGFIVWNPSLLYVFEYDYSTIGIDEVFYFEHPISDFFFL